MNGKIRGIVVILLLAALGSFAFAGGSKEKGTETSGAQQKAKQRTIVFVNPLVGHPVYIAQEEGMNLAAKDLGFKPVVVGPATIDAQNMVNEMETAIVQKVDGIVTVPINWSAFENVYKKAAEAKIPIVNTGAETPADWRLSYIGTDNTAYGILAADLLAKKMNGKASICIMMSQLDIPNQVEQKTAFERRIAEKYPHMKIKVVESDKADMLIAVQKFQEIFRANPDINTVLELEATGGNAAAKVIDEMGLKGKITILAIDDMKETIDNIDKGLIWGTLAQNFYKQGYLSAKFIMDYYEGKKIPPVVDAGVILITKDNVKSYTDDMWAFLKELK